MSDPINQTIGGGNATKQDASIDLRPTLFIGVGGTGMEVLMRVRRRILNNLWGTGANRNRVESLADFPVAQFIQFDLDSGAVIDSGRAQTDDLQYDLVKFSDEDKIVESFDIEKYSRDDDALEKYPHIKDWQPLTPKKIRELGIDPSKGAGQIRAVSRLYFFDKYTKVRDKIRLKLKTLKAGLSHERQLSQLGLKMELSKFRIVVVGSVAGGTGSGAFLDMGFLARWLARSEVGQADVELMLFLPTGYSGANKDRTEANGYAALMELESAMLGNKGYIGRWDAYDQPELPREPYNEVYLIDSGNVAQQHTKNVQDVYHMVADALFEDFASGDFARRKRSVAVNQAQHKNFLHDALVPKNRFPDMRLSFAKRYSSMGQAVLDTRQESQREERAHRWAGAMLSAFFGVGAADLGANRATDKQRDEFMSAQMALRAAPFSDFPEFSDKTVELKRSSGEFLDYLVVDELLKDKHGMLLAGVEQRVNQRIDDIRSSFDRAEWPTQVRDAIKQLERDAVRDQDSTADTTEDRVSKRRKELLDTVRKAVRDQLYSYLDNKEFGGLEYVLSLVEQIKDRLEVPGNGLVAALQTNAGRYHEIKEAVRSREVERLLNNLSQTRGGLFGGGEKQAVLVLDQLRTEIANGIKFHLRAKAAEEAAILLTELSIWLGQKTGVDAQGRAIWNGLVGEFQRGRDAVVEMLGLLQKASTILQQELSKEHATLIRVAAAMPDEPLPGAVQLREWADEAFMDLGGSKMLFPMLADPDQQRQLLSKVTRMAERKIALATSGEGADKRPDPLLEALEQMNPAQRQETFRKLLACAMPWIDANLSGDFTVRADQYKCFIGVAGAEEFERRFKAELEAAVPTQTGLTAAQLSVVETGVPGRAVCYCELSGYPMTVLRGLEGWRTSYRKEAEKSPTHTHIDATQFTHPIAPTTDEINRLAEDFKHYLLAVMLGVLTRSTQRIVPTGQYQFAVARGDVRRIGNERAFRLNGLPVAYRDTLVSRVQDQLADLGGYSLVALAVLAAYYETAVYTPKLVSDSTGAEQVRKGFASAISAEIKQDLMDRARRKGVSDMELRQGFDKLDAQLKSWAVPVGDSDVDAYDWEVREPGEDGVPRLKYTLMPQALDSAFVQALLAPAAAGSAPISVAVAAPVVAPFAAAVPVAPAASLGLSPGLTAPPLGGPALPAAELQYQLGIQGAKYGPYTVAKLAEMLALGQISGIGTKVWRPGLSGWVELSLLPELAHLFQAPPELSNSLDASPPLN